MANVDAAPFLKDVKIDDAAVKAYYDANAASLQTPEQAKFEYVILSQESLASQVSVDAAEVKSQYEKNQAQYGKGEEPDTAHGGDQPQCARAPVSQFRQFVAAHGSFSVRDGDEAAASRWIDEMGTRNRYVLDVWAGG